MKETNRLLKNGRRNITAALMVLAVIFVAAHAAGNAVIMEQYVTGDSALLYVSHSGENLTAEARIGTETVKDVTLTDAGEVPVVTWLLVDNSISINNGDREKTKQFLSDMVAGRTANERFNLCTYHDDKLEILVQDSQDYADLKGKIDAIEYINQETFLTDVLDELLDIEEAREEPAYVRVVVISDGVDNNPGGLTREELNQRLKEQRLPIYTLGCKNKGNDQILKEMYSLSRQTNGQSWPLSEQSDTLGIVQAMGGAELPLCAAVKIPEKLQDGTSKGLQLTFSDGTVVETQVSMPFGSVTEPEPVEEPPAPAPEPEPEPEPVPAPEPESFFEKNFTLIIIVLAIIAALIAGLTIFLLIRRKREREKIQVVDSSLLDMGMDETDIAESTHGGDTVILVNNDSQLTLILTDRANPNRHFESPLRGKVTIGRSSGNQIVLDYEKSVSGVHCEIFVDGNIFKIRDLNSKNGTYVDGIRVGDAAEISNGSTIKLGRLELMVEIR